MKLFRKTIELDEKGMNEFITSVSEENAPRYKKRDEHRSNTSSGSYWDTLAAERDNRNGRAASDYDDDYEEDYLSDPIEEPFGEEYKVSNVNEDLLDQRESLSREFRNAFIGESKNETEATKAPKASKESGLKKLFSKKNKEEKEEKEAVEPAPRENVAVRPRRRREVSKADISADNADDKTVKPLRLTGRMLRDVAVERCESIQEARLQLNLLRTEYQEVTAYLQDTQLIERLDDAEKGEISETGRHLLAIKKEIERTGRRRRNLTDYQINVLERYEDIVPLDITKIEEDEEYQTLIKDDLQKLEGEKGEIIFEKEAAEDKREFLKKLSVVAAVVIFALLILYLFLFMNTELDIVPEFLLTILCAIILVTYMVIENRKTLFTIKMSDKKMNKLIALQNKIKIKYVNSTSTLDFIYDKYAINNSKELKYRWEQYVVMKDEMRLQRKNTEVLAIYEREIENFMTRLGVHDPEVWIYQANALVDPREMVEIKHRLNTRRGKLRESIDYNQQVVDESLDALRDMIKEMPDKENEIRMVLSDYEIVL